MVLVVMIFLPLNHAQKNSSWFLLFLTRDFLNESFTFRNARYVEGISLISEA